MNIARKIFRTAYSNTLIAIYNLTFIKKTELRYKGNKLNKRDKRVRKKKGKKGKKKPLGFFYPFTISFAKDLRVFKILAKRIKLKVFIIINKSSNIKD
jgi:hypothetical protein